MRKTIIRHIAALAYIFIPVCLTGQIPGYDDLFPKEDTLYFPPLEVVHEGRELPRTQTISYNSEAASLERGHGESLYLQPLAQNLKREEGNGKTTFSTRFKMPFVWAERQPILYVGGAGNSYDIYINGEKTAYNQSGRTPAEFDIRDYVREGMNDLDIIVYGDPVSSLLSSSGNRKPALDGEVYIVSQPKVRIRDYSAEVNFEGGDATVQLGVILKTHLLNPKRVKMYYRLLSPDGEEVALGNREADIAGKEEDTVRFFFAVGNVRSWSHETPDLYTLLLKTQHEGVFTEYVSYKIGFRTVEMREGRLLVNGYEVPLSVYEYGERSDSASTAQRLAALKAEGYNMLKLKGYPQPPYFYELCDHIGLYVCDQADINTSAYGDSRQTGGNPSNDPAWEESFTDRAVSMYYNSQNHASVIMFSLAEKSSNGYNLYRSYEALKHAEHSRPIIYLDAGGEWNTDAVTAAAARQYPGSAGERIVFGNKKDERVSADIRPLFTTDGKGRYTIKNNATVSPLRGKLVYTVKQGGKKISEGALPIDIAPGTSAEYEIPVDAGKPNKKFKYDVKLASNIALE